MAIARYPGERTGIAGYSILNLVHERPEAFPDARPNATYQDDVVLWRGRSRDFASWPGVVVALVEML
jgi:hypothetical protein